MYEASSSVIKVLWAEIFGQDTWLSKSFFMAKMTQNSSTLHFFLALLEESELITTLV